MMALCEDGSKVYLPVRDEGQTRQRLTNGIFTNVGRA